MSIQFILGRAGTGKSNYCYEEIKQNIDKKNKIYIITPEQFSYMAEKKLLETIGRQAVINAEVLTFNRMADVPRRFKLYEERNKVTPND